MGEVKNWLTTEFALFYMNIVVLLLYLLQLRWMNKSTGMESFANELNNQTFKDV